MLNVCSLLKSPLPPPDYLDKRGDPHKRGMILQEPPVCSRCSDSPASIEKLEQHADVLKRPKEQTRPPKRILEGSSGHVSLEQPLSKEANFVTNDPLKCTSTSRSLPAWMSLLPSQKNAEIHPPKHSIMQRRSTFPYFETTRMSTPQDSPARTPPEDLSKVKDATHSVPLTVPREQSSRGMTRPQLSNSWIRPHLSSSNLSFLTFVDNQPEESDQHTDYVPEIPLCPSAYVVQPSINFSRSRQPSIAKSAPSVIGISGHAGTERARRRLQKRSPVKMADEATAIPKVPERSQNERPRRKSRPWKLDWSRSTSLDEEPEQCPQMHHTPEPSQEIDAAKPPFLKELSGFLVHKAGKWILPSRVGETGVRHGGHALPKTPSCPRRECDAISGDVCDGCQNRLDVPKRVV